MNTLFNRSLMLVLLFVSSFSNALEGPYESIYIGGVSMHCTTAQNQRAAIYIDPSVNDYIGIAYNNGFPNIHLGPGFFNSVPGVVGQFWFLHECAHHVVGSNEANADCFAIRNMRNLGLMNNHNQVSALISQMHHLQGSYTRLPGPQRVLNVLNCFNS